MTWTSNPPKEEGWYWWKYKDGLHIEALYVYKSSIYPAKFATQRNTYAELVEDLGGLWYSEKIKEPPT